MPLTPIGAAALAPVKVLIIPIFSLLPQVKVKLEEPTSSKVAIFQNKAVVILLLNPPVISISVQEASGAVGDVDQAFEQIWATIKSPTAKFVGLTITQLALVAPGLMPYSLKATAINHYVNEKSD